MTTPPPKPALKRSIGLMLLTFYGIGTILGAGIYVLVGEVAGRAGIYAPLSFGLAAILALFSAFSYAELAARFPFSAGEAVYVEEAFHHATLSALIGYLVVTIGLVSSATLVHGFARYLGVFVTFPEWLVLGGSVIAMGIIAAWGVKESLTITAVMTLVEIFGLILVVWVGTASVLDQGLVNALLTVAENRAAATWAGIFGGAFIAFYAYVGFEDMVNVAEEVRDPHRNLPRAIIMALGITTFFYFIVSITAVLVLTPAELTTSSAPLALLYEKATGNPPIIISLIGLFAVINGALVQTIMASRVLYGMGKRRWAPPAISAVNSRTHTPVRATALVASAILILALWFPLVTLAQITSLLTLLLFLLINAALIVIKRQEGSAASRTGYPLAVPWLGILTITIFLIITVTN